MISCEIPGRPIPCPRPRVGKRTHYEGPYNAWRAEAQTLLRQACIKQNGGRLMEGPVSVEVWFTGMHGNSDLDNCVKAVLDAAQGQVFTNDRQVAHLEAWRCIPEAGWPVGTRIQIERVGG